MDTRTYVSLVESDNVVRYTATATMALLVYDHFIALSDEYRYIWRAQFSLLKVALLTNRYMPSITTGLILYMDLFAKSFCKQFLLMSSILFCSGFVIAESILLMRLYAMWYRNRIILFLLVSLFIPSAFIAYYGTVQFALFTSSSELVLQSRGCVFVASNGEAYESLLSLLFFETCMLGLLLCKYYRLKIKSALIETLCRDGAFFYVSVLVLTATNLVLLKTAPPSLCSFFLIAQGALHSILSTRLILRLRDAAYDAGVHAHPSADGPRNLNELSLTGTTSTSMQFSSVASDIVLSP